MGLQGGENNQGARFCAVVFDQDEVKFSLLELL
jgi:hypothetical protein